MTNRAIVLQGPVTYDAAELATLQEAGEALATTAASFTCPDDPSYQALDGILSAVLVELDTIDATKRTVTDPLRTAIKATDRLFAPVIAPRDAVVAMCKRLMADYAQAKALAERAARALALEAAKRSDDGAMAQALTVAAAVAAPVDAGAQTRWRWVVKRIVPELLPDEYWTPDEKKIGAIAKAWPGKSEDPPVVPGVVFEREALIAGKHG